MTRLLRIFPVLVLVGLLAGCADGPTPREVMLGAQGVFNASVTGENLYAHQPFCGDVGAPQPPFCAKAETVVEMAEHSTNAKEALDIGWAAVLDPNLDPNSVMSIVSVAIQRVGDFRGLLLKYGISVAPAVPSGPTPSTPAS